MSDQSKPLSAAEIEELRELESKATKGPWAFSPYGDENRCGVGVVMDENDEPIVGLDETEDGIVVEPVAPEVDGYANAALITAMRNALPRLLALQRLLAMLTPPAENDGSKGLVDGIKAISAEFGHNWMSKEQMTPISKPPADADVMEAVRYFDDLRGEWSDEQLEVHLETLLDYVRAAQARCVEPTCEEVREAVEIFDALPHQLHSIGPAYFAALHRAKDVFLSHIRAAQAPRLTGERLEAVKWAYDFIAQYGFKASAWIDERDSQRESEEMEFDMCSGLAHFRAAFPELGEG